MKKIISLLLLSGTIVLASGWDVKYDYDKMGYLRYYVVNDTGVELFCWVNGERGYYQEFYVGTGRNNKSRKYYTPRESFRVNCEAS